MPRILFTVDDLVSQVRSQIDELNQDSVSDEEILAVLNRGQDYAFDILARKYPEPILQQSPLTIVGGQREYDIPENIFEDRLLKLELVIPSGSGATYLDVQQISYRDMSQYETTTQTSTPIYFCIYGRKIRFSAIPTGTYNGRIWSLRSPEKLVLPQGRVTLINTAQNYLIVDAVGSSLTTESDQLGSYVNIVDGQTGEIRASRQLQIIGNDNKLTFRQNPTRSTVLNREIGGSIDTSPDPVIVEQDDYIAPIDGTCVPYFGRPTTNFLIEFAAAELVRKLGGDAATEEKILEKFETQLERTFAGRKNTLRIAKKSRIWGVPYRRYIWQ